MSEVVRIDTLGARPTAVLVIADAPTRAAIAARFDLLGLDALEGRFTLTAEAGGARVRGAVTARAVQACAVSGEPVVAAIDEEAVDLRFVRDLGPAAADEEVELSADDCDVVPLDDERIDLLALAADTLALALPPFPRADATTLAAARARLSSEEEALARIAAEKRDASPFAGLARPVGGPASTGSA